MKVERLRSSVLSVTLHAYEMATLMAAARWAAEKGEDELPPESLEQLRLVLGSYDEAMRSIDVPN
ncbi:MAG: hypothetical protein LC751_04620 [Actinobacteria bacterium]|nr:hypothetical protein [Actinomycetota bacterium]